MAWGLWEQRSEMTGKLADADLSRLARGGIAAFSSAEGVALFDVARTLDAPVVLPMRLDLAALAGGPGPVPPLLRGLVRTPVRPAARRATAAGATGGTAADGADGLMGRLAGLPDAERDRLLLELVRTEAARVLGCTDPHAIDVDRGLLELGFDSLTAVELRNRLGAATGLRLPATLLFDHPTPSAIAGHLAAKWPRRAGGRPGGLRRTGPAGVRTWRGGRGRAARTRLTARLQRPLVEAGPGPGSGAARARSPSSASASDDEIFDFIENELGLS